MPIVHKVRYMSPRPKMLATFAAVLIILMAVSAYYLYRTQYLPSELRVAAADGDLRRVQELLKSGVDVNQPLGQLSNAVLNRAIEGGNPAVVEAILNAGAHVNALGETGSSPLIIAAFFGNPKIITLLIEHGARTDTIEQRHRSTALLAAIRKGHSDAVRALINGGADPNQGKEWGDSPLCRAEASRQAENVSTLRRAGATCP